MSTGTPSRVRVVGTGLIGASAGLALSRAGWQVELEDASQTTAALARDLGAGTLPGEGSGDPDLVVVATPPDVTAAVVRSALERWPDAVVTDVASVKGVIVEELRDEGVDLARYCGSHPMAGRERSGAISARADLFHGRAWVLTPTAETSPAAVALVRRAATDTGAAIVELDAAAHDAAVAAVSHVPQLAASLVAARLEDLPESALELAGQGLRDVTRIAASDAGLWTQILAGNAAAVRSVLVELSRDLEAVISALTDLGPDPAVMRPADAPGARGTLARAVAAGNAGHARIPGKHGGGQTSYATVRVLIPDEPGQLGRLFADVGDTGTNIEEFRLDHGLGQAFGVGEVQVVPAAAAHLAEALQQRGWRIHD
ncbi:MAG: prephenate dehydrogenase [Actinobacteria bacterium]|nr:prephenate dehydrogenase [Actinomycetota bacterium]